ncbi:MAG: hypothetical protein KBT53_07290 [Porticoccus sp.]|nr:hypothetical protein [Porticoccus sp.]MBQ0807941.1 hypothetical protein [Porticoccus sp.]
MAIVDKELIKNYQEIHASKDYGFTSSQYKSHIQACINEIKPKSILEFGCGQSTLVDGLVYEAEYYRYDPAVPQFANIPIDKADFIINTDVLEHIPAKDVGEVVAKMKSISDHVFYNIATDYANEILPNGENAHCTVWPGDKWLELIRQYYPDAEIAYYVEKKSCLIITWKSPGTKQLIHDIERVRVKSNNKVDHMFKKIERRLRQIRNYVIGKNRPRKPL